MRQPFEILSADLHGRIPPHAFEVEEAVLGSMLLDLNCIPLVIHKLTRDHFYRPEHQYIFQAIMDIYPNHELRVDLLTVNSHMRDNGTLELSGGSAHLASLTNKVASTVNIEYHVAILTQIHVKRQAIRIGQEMAQKGYDAETDGFEIVGQITTQLYNLTNSAMKKQISTFKQGLKKVLSDMDQPFAKDGIRSGFPELDNILGGFQPSDLVVLAARPGMGKTALMCSIMRHIAGTGVGVGLFSLEMSQDQIIKRMLSSEAQIPTGRFRTSDFAEREWERIHTMSESFHDLPIQIDDTAGPSLVEVNAKARQMHARGAKIVFVDFLQLIKTGGHHREQEVAEVARGLKNTAKDLNIPVVALCQLSRGVESRSDKRPQLSDLRESGEIEQSADSVVFLLRPEYYKVPNFDYHGQTVQSEGRAILDIAKNRHGATTDILLNFINELTKFTN